MDDSMRDTLNANICCKVCGERNFSERDGFYYCEECCTKQDQVRQVEVEHDNDFQDNVKHTKKQKIQAVKAEKPLLTSWECYNYILRGLVEELLSYGAKEEIKLVALQVWAAYLRKSEVAFFNKAHSDLPKLGVRYLKVDAEAIYNYKPKVPKKRAQKKAKDSNPDTTDEQTKNRDFRKSVRKLNESMYSAISSVGSQSFPSTATNTVRAMRLRYNSKSRHFLKKTMSSKHLDKHENDVENILMCHKPPRCMDLPRFDHYVSLLNMKQIYSILGIALNLVEDDFQLSDLARFIQFGHIGVKNVLQYFPSNIASNGIKMLKNIDFYKYGDKYSDKSLRDHIATLCRYIGIKEMKTPNMIKLVKRYVEELCLPPAVAVFVERLINLLPPRFPQRRIYSYPHYEARAMAYIIFVMKLLFGLDGHKEQQISKHAHKVNRKIKHFNKKYNESEALLFVWSDWVQYIEMRKVVVSHYNVDFCKQYGQKPSTDQFLEEMTESIRHCNEQAENFADEVDNSANKQRINDIKEIFKKLVPDKQSGLNQVKFKPTLTPALTYFNNILAYLNSQDPNTNDDQTIEIPTFMKIDYAQRNIMPFVEFKPFLDYCEKKGYTLKLIEVPVTTNRNFVGIFRPPIVVSRGFEAIYLRVQKADFDVTQEAWSERIAKEVPLGVDCLEFKNKLEAYNQKYMQNKVRARKKAQLNELLAGKLASENSSKLFLANFILPPSEFAENFLKEKQSYPNSLYSFEVFSECNMDPLPNLDKPRRNLDADDLLADLSDDETETNEIKNNSTLLESSDNADTSKGSLKKKSLSLYVSNMDYWLLFGYLITLKNPQKKQLQEKFPHSFNWLLETCSQTLGMEWTVVYEQLMIIELMFGVGIKNLDDFKNCLYFNYNIPIKDFNILMNNYREMW